MPEKLPPVTMADPYFTDDDRRRIHEQIDGILSGALSMGPHVKAFEDEFAGAMGARHAVAMNACTAALEASLAALGLEPGDEVIVPPLTFVATGMAVHLGGGVPVFAEISETTLALDPADVRRRVTRRTRGVILVHMAGLLSPDTAALRAFCDQSGLFLIEDAAHAVGARFSGKAAGTFGHAGCFSFFPTKVITSGEGGMAITDDDALARRLRSLQHRGRDLGAPIEQYAVAGRNVRMPEISALLGRVQLARLEEFLDKRRAVGAAYLEELSGFPGASPVTPVEPRGSSWWKFPLLLSPGIDRVAVIKALDDEGIRADWGYPPLHLQPVLKTLYDHREGELPRSEAVMARLLCLPCHPRVPLERARRAARVLKSCCEARA